MIGFFAGAARMPGDIYPLGVGLCAGVTYSHMPFVAVGAILGSLAGMPFALTGRYIVAILVVLGIGMWANYNEIPHARLVGAAGGSIAFSLTSIIYIIKIGTSAIGVTGLLVEMLMIFAFAFVAENHTKISDIFNDENQPTTKQVKADVLSLSYALADVADTVEEVCRALPQDVNTPNIYDYVSEGICKNCKNNCACWVGSGNKVIDSITKIRPVLESGKKLSPLELPAELRIICKEQIKLCEFLNGYFAQSITTRCDKATAEILRAAITSQLTSVADTLADTVNNAGTSLEPRVDVICGFANSAAEEVCADATRTFYDKKGRVHLLLCDGAGVGKAAAVDGAMAASLLRRLVASGFTATSAAKLVNIALGVTGLGGSTTIDVASLDLADKSCTLYKAGGAPTYYIRSGKAGCYVHESLPVGLLKQVNGGQTSFNIAIGDVIVLVSDGILSSGGSWIKQELIACRTLPAQAIAERVLATAKEKHNGRLDDMSVAVAKIMPIY